MLIKLRHDPHPPVIFHNLARIAHRAQCVTGQDLCPRRVHQALENGLASLLLVRKALLPEDSRVHGEELYIPLHGPDSHITHALKQETHGVETFVGEESLDDLVFCDGLVLVAPFRDLTQLGRNTAKPTAKPTVGPSGGGVVAALKAPLCPKEPCSSLRFDDVKVHRLLRRRILTQPRARCRSLIQCPVPPHYTRRATRRAVFPPRWCPDGSLRLEILPMVARGGHDATASRRRWL
mmetsp:Transcript_28628/g.70093  ORF Transcript_28628/g.70093 Transcript_28628/m.70093 type:complete len:236 (-) Transcript_28628:191-898(-)